MDRCWYYSPVCERVFLVYNFHVTKMLTYEYIVECIKSKIWEN
jgi:hypothetical protein